MKPSSTTSTSEATRIHFFGKVAGFDVTNRYRLENIQIKSAGVVKRKYRFTYNTSTATSAFAARHCQGMCRRCRDELLSAFDFLLSDRLRGITGGRRDSPCRQQQQHHQRPLRLQWGWQTRHCLLEHEHLVCRPEHGRRICRAVQHGPDGSKRHSWTTFLPNGRAALSDP